MYTTVDRDFKIFRFIFLHVNAPIMNDKSATKLGEYVYLPSKTTIGLDINVNKTLKYKKRYYWQ